MLHRRHPLFRRTRLAPRRASRRTITPKERAHLARVRALPCVACRRAGLIQTSPTEAHHIKRNPHTGRTLGLGQKASHWWTIPLCRGLHHWNGVQVHQSQAQFEAENGNELELLDDTYGQLGYSMPEAA